MQVRDVFKLGECEEIVLASEIFLTTEMRVLIRRKVSLNIRTSTLGCIRAIGILLSRTAREEAREEGGERTLEHG